jgi:hypothetical protein
MSDGMELMTCCHGTSHQSRDLITIDFILEVIGYTTARLVLPLITLGRVRV